MCFHYRLCVGYSTILQEPEHIFQNEFRFLNLRTLRQRINRLVTRDEQPSFRMSGLIFP